SALVASVFALSTSSSQSPAHTAFRSLNLLAFNFCRTSASPTLWHEAMKRSSLVIVRATIWVAQQRSEFRSWGRGGCLPGKRRDRAESSRQLLAQIPLELGPPSYPACRVCSLNTVPVGKSVMDE